MRAQTFSFARYLVLLLATIVVVSSVVPFEFSVAGLPKRLAEVYQWDAEGGFSEVYLHFFVFFGLGFASSCGYRSSFTTKFGLVCFCFLIEAAQLFLPDRHARIIDLLVNTSAGILGSLLGGHNRLRFAGSKVIPFLRSTSFAAASIWLTASFLPITRISLHGWEHQSRIVVGNELDRSEPWMGIVSRLEIVANTATKGEPTAEVRLIYDFTSFGDGGIRAGSPSITSNADLILPNGLTTANGVSLAGDPILSAGTMEEFSRRLASAGSFRIVADLYQTFDSTSLAGRLVSFSVSPSARNFMLGREGNDLVFRVRDGVMEENGPRHILRARNALRSESVQLQATYCSGVASLSSDGKMLKIIDLRQPTVSLGLGNTYMAAVCAGILLAVAVAFPAYLLLPFQSRIAHMIAIAGILVLAIVPYGITCLVLGGAPGLSFVSILSVAIGLTYLVAHFFCAPNVSVLLQSGFFGSQNPRQEG